MTEFYNPDWNLSQAAAWVVYRENILVEQCANPTANSFSSIANYTTMWPKGRRKHSSLIDLHSALRDGKIVARGYHCDTPNTLAQIPKENWADLHLSPPNAYKGDNLTKKEEPWTHIRVLSSEVRKQWRTTIEKEYRTKYSSALIQEFQDLVLARSPNLVERHNELCEEIAALHQEKFPDKKVPSRSTIQRHLKKLP